MNDPVLEAFLRALHTRDANRRNTPVDYNLIRRMEQNIAPSAVRRSRDNSGQEEDLMDTWTKYMSMKHKIDRQARRSLMAHIYDDNFRYKRVNGHIYGIPFSVCTRMYT